MDKATENPRTSDQNALLTRVQVARRLGLSVSTIRRMEKCELIPVVIDGKHMFASQDVEKYTRHSDGELAASAFQQFNQGKSPVELVIEMKIPPQRIEKIHDAWVRMSSAVVVVAPSPFTITRWKQILKIDRFSWTMLAKAMEIIMREPKLMDRWMQDIHRGKALK